MMYNSHHLLNIHMCLQQVLAFHVDYTFCISFTHHNSAMMQVLLLAPFLNKETEVQKALSQGHSTGLCLSQD